METRTEHTPCLGSLARKGAAIMSGSEVVALACHDWVTADEIIRRCNSHADLAAALKKAWSAVVVAQAEGFSCPGLQDEIEAALAKAGE